MKKYIYSLTCPISKKVKYIGYTNNKNSYTLNSKELDKWVEQLYLFRSEPEFSILELVSNTSLKERVSYWTTLYVIDK